MYASMQGRYIEHIMQQNLPEQILDKVSTSSGKSDDDPIEHWNKRDSSAGRSKSKSKYFNPPKKLTKSKSKMKTVTVQQDHRDKDTQVSEGLLHVFAHTYSVMDTIYLMSHYTAGCILFGDRGKLPQQSLKKVNFSNFRAVLSFVLVNNNHWNLLYIHAETSTVYLVDPAQRTSELKASQTAAKRIREYFMMRRTCHGKTDWVDVKWKEGVMSHPIQQDGSSCGVIVVKMAKALLKASPVIPDIDFSTSKREMEKERRDLALHILEASATRTRNCHYTMDTM
ncbi:uncharacterized protein LOC117810743 isoform X2 [Notolabrus celidotus]|uniref:uncharacterized protein LOC117810743 isoform X2 n=1 Tax=Notolabrus celidotus TaxID=1203425 RepID=UPI001490028E|nr:uncharacterized protein LOC117810743 isoform X2 [Notolabrus celidotus]